MLLWLSLLIFDKEFDNKKLVNPIFLKFYTIVCQNLLCTNRKKSPPNHFIGAASSNKVKASINNLLFALEIHLCDFKLLLAEFKKCKGVLIAFLHFTFLKQFKPVKDDSTHLKFHKTMR